jgi:radical SAM superfamily enzyme YgiQ (UPF0313 family)
MTTTRPRVVFVQLPIPPVGPVPARGNVPLAAGYMQLLARLRGWELHFAIEILPPALANTLSDQGLVEEIVARRPWLVGFTCYLWNIERSLWIAARLKQRLPEVKILLGGPEITADNAWVLGQPALDFAAIGEGEQTFAELLAVASQGSAVAPGSIDGLYVAPSLNSATAVGLPLADPVLPKFRTPLANLDTVSSPYTAGILDAADEHVLLLETIRGCIFNCKFCYYPKSYDALYFASREKVAANLAHARERGAREVVILDPTLNQRRDFADFVQFLADENPQQQFTYFGELRGEGITPELARLLRQANFEEVEIGLQSVDPQAQALMDRPNNLRAFERGARAMLAAGIRVKVDLIIGLPGDTADSIRRGIDYFLDTEFCRNVQVFQLSVLPGTAFRQEAAALGLRFQARPPYYVLETPTLALAEMVDLMREAQERFGTEFDSLPDPVLDFDERTASIPVWRVDLEGASHGDVGNRYHSPEEALPPATSRAQAFSLWLRAANFDQSAARAAKILEQLLTDNPHSTLQIILEPTGDARNITPRFLEMLRRVCYRQTSYLDQFYSLAPGRPIGAKRLVVLCPWQDRVRLGERWIAAVAEYATIVWRGGGDREQLLELDPREIVMA